MELLIIPADRIIFLDGVGFEIADGISGPKLKRKFVKDVLKERTEEVETPQGEKNFTRKKKYVEKENREENIAFNDVRFIRYIDGKSHISLNSGKSFFTDEFNPQPFLDAWQIEKDKFDQEQEKEPPEPTDDEKISSYGTLALAKALIKKGLVSKTEIISEIEAL